MTLTSVIAADVFQKRARAITGRVTANRLTGGGLPRDRGSAPLVTRLSGSSQPNLRETGVQLLRWSVRDLRSVTTDMTTGHVDRATTCKDPDGTTAGSGDVFACTGIRCACYARNDFCAVHLDQSIR